MYNVIHMTKGYKHEGTFHANGKIIYKLDDYKLYINCKQIDTDNKNFNHTCLPLTSQGAT